MRLALPSIASSAPWAIARTSRPTLPHGMRTTSTARRTTPGRALIDTGALLALANPRDQYHSRATAIGRRFVKAGGRWVGSALVLAEFHAHLLRWRDAGLARGLIEHLMADPLYQWVDVPITLVEAAIAEWLGRYADQRFSLTDAVSFELMRREGLTVAFAFDGDFRTAGYELL